MTPVQTNPVESLPTRAMVCETCWGRIPHLRTHCEACGEAIAHHLGCKPRKHLRSGAILCAPCEQSGLPDGVVL